jgi:hypothetical protein
VRHTLTRHPPLRALALLTATALVAAAWVGGAHADAPRGAYCGSHPVRVLAQHGSAAVYEVRSYGTLSAEACDRNVATTLSFGPPADAVQRDSVDITDRAIGYAIETCSPDESTDTPCTTIIVRGSRRGRHPVKAVAVNDPTATRSQVTRLRVGPTNATAWISCHRFGTTAGEADPTTQPTCAKAGRQHAVYVIPANASANSTPIRLAIGTRISPTALAVGTKRITWRDGGQLRHALIPR